MTTAKEQNVASMDMYIDLPYVTLKDNEWTNSISLQIEPTVDDNFQIAFQCMPMEQVEGTASSRIIFGVSGTGSGKYIYQTNRSTGVSTAYAQRHDFPAIKAGSTCIVTQTDAGIFCGTDFITSDHITINDDAGNPYQIFCLNGGARKEMTFYGKIFWVKILRNKQLIADFRPQFDGTTVSFMNMIGSQRVVHSQFQYGIETVKTRDLVGVEI